MAMQLRPEIEVTVTSDRYTGQAIVDQVYPSDNMVAIRPIELQIMSSRGPRAGGGRVFIVKPSECVAVVRDPVKRYPVVRTPGWPFVFGIAGPKKVGKSTTASELRDALMAHRLPSETRSFATPLYQAVATILGIPERVLRDQTIKDRPLTTAETSNPCVIGKTPREILEWQGESVRKFFGIDHWIHRAFNQLLFIGSPGVVIFDDARHDAEFEAIDVNIELSRDGLKYPCNHPSAMPPQPQYITRKIDLNTMSPRAAGELLADVIVGELQTRGLSW